jgi:geranylgeranylglycerol-phosphate geranylgeranyltransferase
VSTSGSDVRALLALIRPLNGLLAAVAVVVGAFAAARSMAPAPAFWGAASAFAAAAGANAFNDWHDREADSLNRPGRPIPSGRATPRAAMVVAVVAYAAALALAVPVGGAAVGLAFSWVVLTVLYSQSLSRVPLLGNAVVALVAASPFIMGGISQLGVPPRTAPAGAAVLVPRTGVALSAVPAGLAFLAHLAREVVKDGEDRAGDARVGARTFAVLFGESGALALARFVVVILMVAALLPYGVGIYGPLYLAVVVLIEGILAWRFVLARRDASTAGFTRLSRTLKVVMALGLVAVVLGVV